MCSYDEDGRYKRRLVDGISNTFFVLKKPQISRIDTDFTD
nr:hypothetical protein BSM_32140 [uncultured archaeon]